MEINGSRILLCMGVRACFGTASFATFDTIRGRVDAIQNFSGKGVLGVGVDNEWNE